MPTRNRSASRSRSDADEPTNGDGEQVKPVNDFPELDEETLASIYGDLDSMLDAPLPEGWKPNAGDKLIGDIIGLDTANVGGYGDYPLVTVKRYPDGEIVAVHAFHEVLMNELIRHRIYRFESSATDDVLIPNDAFMGRRIGIKYEGEIGAKTARPGRKETYNSYRVAVDRPSQTR